MEYTLSKRTTEFSIQIIAYCKKVRFDIFTREIIDQLFRASMSIGANYAEANGASSKRDFRNKIHICKKECLEADYWLHVLGSVDRHDSETHAFLVQEIHELTLIFSKIAKSCRVGGVKIQN